MKEKTKNYRKKQEVDEDGLEIGKYVYATYTLRVRIVTLRYVLRPYGVIRLCSPICNSCAIILFPTSFMILLSYTTSIVEEEEPDLIDDDDVIKFRWDGKGRFMDLPKLASTLEEAHAAEESMSGYRER